jgi:hypothetical protein
MSSNRSRDRRRQEEWRECLPRIAEIVEEFGPKIAADSYAEASESVPSAAPLVKSDPGVLVKSDPRFELIAIERCWRRCAKEAPLFRVSPMVHA